MAKILSCLRKSTVRQTMIKDSIPELLIVMCLSNDKQRYAPITEDEIPITVIPASIKPPIASAANACLSNEMKTTSAKIQALYANNSKQWPA